MNRQEVEKKTWDFLHTKGLPDKSISAAMGNIEAESEFSPDLIEEGNGIGFGLCQWSFERRTQLESYGTSFDCQLNFLWSELTGENTSVTHAEKQWINKSGYLSYDDFMAGNGSIEDLTAAFCFCWERPNEELAHLDRRKTSAVNYYNTYNGKGEIYNPGTGGGSGESNTIKVLKNIIGDTDRFIFPVKFNTLGETFTKVSTIGDYSVIKNSKGQKYKIKNKYIK